MYLYFKQMKILIDEFDYQNLFIIGHSSDAGEENIIQFTKAGADTFLEKPGSCEKMMVIYEKFMNKFYKQT